MSSLESTPPTNEMLDIALAANAAGLCVVPPKQDGSKRPLKAWEKYTRESSTIEEIHSWYGLGDRTGLGIVLGAPSGNLECFEFDDVDAYREFLELAEEAGLDDIVHKLESGYLESSPNGIHWLYRCSEISGNTKLAQKGKTPDLKVLIETRGQGGYAIIAPSHGDVHPSGQPYRLQAGGFSSIPTITPEEREAIWNLARSMDRTSRSIVEPQVTNSKAVLPPGNEPTTKPGDWFNQNKTWDEVLSPHGWTHVFDHGVESFWRRPGKSRDHSASTNYENTDILKVFSSSTLFDPDKSYNKFAAYAVLNHGGDFSAAARDIAKQMPTELRKPDRHLELYRPDRTALTPDVQSPSDEPDGSTSVAGSPPQIGDSWKRVDLSGVLTGDIQNLNLPELLHREDDVMLLYPSRIHEFKGLPEAGKGWLALIACKQELRDGNNVAYIDLEDHAEGIVERLLAMGVSHERIETHFAYYHPEETFGDESRAAFFAEIAALAPTLVVIDSVAEIMASNGLDPLSNKDAATFINMLPRPLSILGPAVVLIDHLTKQNDNTRFSIGAQHKLAAVDGASYVVEAEEPFGRGRKGSSRIAVVKDRPGHVRRYAEGGRYIGRLIVHANDSGTLVDATLGKPLSQTIEGMEASAELMTEVAAYIEGQGKRSPSLKEIREAVKGRYEVVSIALDNLVSSGFLMKEKMKSRGGGFCYTMLKSYDKS